MEIINDDFVQVKGVSPYEDWTEVTRFLANGLVGVEIREIPKEGFIDDAILDEAIEKYGFEKQVDMIQEECIELALAIQKLRRKGYLSSIETEQVIDKIAGIKIMIRQAEKLFNSDKINARVSFKIERLKERLDKIIDYHQIPKRIEE